MIHQDILNGDLHPGQKLVVAELKERYNVGASQIREALVQLSWNKYVTLQPQKGCWVASISSEELKELFEGLSIVGKVLLSKAIDKGDDAWELNVLTAFHKLSKVNLTEPSLDVMLEWEERYSVFHRTLLEGTNAPIMHQFHQELTNQIKRYHHLQRNYNEACKEYADFLKDHESIMKLALARNEEQAIKLLEKHYAATMNLLSGSFEA